MVHIANLRIQIFERLQLSSQRPPTPPPQNETMFVFVHGFRWSPFNDTDTKHLPRESVRLRHGTEHLCLQAAGASLPPTGGFSHSLSKKKPDADLDHPDKCLPWV